MPTKMVREPTTGNTLLLTLAEREPNRPDRERQRAASKELMMQRPIRRPAEPDRWLLRILVEIGAGSHTPRRRRFVRRTDTGQRRRSHDAAIPQPRHEMATVSRLPPQVRYAERQMAHLPLLTIPKLK